MKQYVVIVVIFAILLFATPFAFETLASRDPGQSAQSGIPPEQGSGNSAAFPKTVALTKTATGETESLSVTDYLVGCLLAQIPVDYHDEALKAQAIAAHTYLLRLLADGVPITDDGAVCQPYFSEDRARAHYGDSYAAHLPKLRRAAEYGAGRVILHNGEPIYAVYHSISAGVTNTAYSVWGRDFPYLRSVESSWDREHPDYLAVNEITAESVRESLFGYNRGGSMPLDYGNWFASVTRNDYGYVISVKAGDSLLSGGDMWRVFGLRSTSFEITYKSGGVFAVETRGYGHGAGLSQYGANVLGGRGFSCEDILRHYYSGVEVALA